MELPVTSRINHTHFRFLNHSPSSLSITSRQRSWHRLLVNLLSFFLYSTISARRAAVAVALVRFPLAAAFTSTKRPADGASFDARKSFYRLLHQQQQQQQQQQRFMMTNREESPSQQEEQQTSSSSDPTTATTASLLSSDNSNDDTLFWPESNHNLKNQQSSSDHEPSDSKNQHNTHDNPLSQVLDSILKVHCTHSEPDYLIPWQKQHQSTSTSSGFVIQLNLPNSQRPRKAIMTNAHSVEYGSVVQVQRRGGDRKYEARILLIANDCDLAILEVIPDDDEEEEEQDEIEATNSLNEFWQGLTPLTFGKLPALQDKVEVLGYPTGGSSLSVTQGVVSRIELQEYSQASTHLLAIQIDAAINAGNSGGPVVNKDLQVIGVAFQGLEGAEGIGYVVPVTVVQHVLKSLERQEQQLPSTALLTPNNSHKKNPNSMQQAYQGFCSLGIRYVPLENKGFRKSLGMLGPNLSGVLVKDCAPTVPSHGILLPNDVICQIDGIPVANDGKIPFRRGERVSMSCYVQTKFTGDTVRLQIWRNRQMMDLDVPVGISRRLIPSHFDNRLPEYVVVGGLVFTALSVPYLYAIDAWEDYISDSVSHLVTKWQASLPREGDQAIILSHVLAHRENLGYETLSNQLLERINGEEIRSLHHLYEYLDSTDDEFLRFEFSAPNGHLIVMERAALPRVTKEVCAEHSIPQPYCLYMDNGDLIGTDDDDDDEESDNEGENRNEESSDEWV